MIELEDSSVVHVLDFPESNRSWKSGFCPTFQRQHVVQNNVVILFSAVCSVIRPNFRWSSKLFFWTSPLTVFDFHVSRSSTSRWWILEASVQTNRVSHYITEYGFVYVIGVDYELIDRDFRISSSNVICSWMMLVIDVPISWLRDSDTSEMQLRYWRKLLFLIVEKEEREQSFLKITRILNDTAVEIGAYFLEDYFLWKSTQNDGHFQIQGVDGRSFVGRVHGKLGWHLLFTSEWSRSSVEIVKTIVKLVTCDKSSCKMFFERIWHEYDVTKSTSYRTNRRYQILE